MSKQVNPLKSLNEVRDEACRLCAERCAGEPGDAASRTPCGHELPLVQLVRALEGRGPCKGRKGKEFCPCPSEELVELAIEAARQIKARQRRRDQLVATWNDG
jgi:hypothetical protein